MAEKAATFVLQHLLPLLEKEIGLSKELGREAQYIKDELEYIQGFLRVADARDEVNESMNICIRHMRDATYDTEDVLEEFLFHLARDHDDGCFGPVCNMIRWIMNFKVRHEIAFKIKGINGRIERIYKRLPNKPFKSLDQSSSTSVTVHDPRGDALLLEEAELVGLEKPKGELIARLLEDKSQCGTISVEGMGGLGKSTLVKKVYDNQKVKGNFECHAWITVSQSFEVKKLLKDMIQQLFDESKEPVPQQLDTMTEDKLKETINQYLQQKRYLIVFDDIWSIAAWDHFQHALPNSNCKSRIMVTTRSSDIASCCETSYGFGHVYTMQPLDPEMSWTLFCKKAFRKDGTCPQHLEDLSRKFLKRCGGLPLAIVAIGGLLATKDNTRAGDWKMVYQSLASNKSENVESMQRVLSLSYYQLPHYLKPCFLYLGKFPEDYIMKSINLIRLWIAEGFIEEQEGRTLEEVGESHLNDLLNRSLIQIAATTLDGRIRSCRVHDLLRDIILSKSKDQNFGTVIDKTRTSHPERIRRLSIHNNYNNIPSTKSLSGLRSLILMKVSAHFNYEFIGGLRLLKVLDLRNAPLETFPNEFTNLFHLRYLCLRRTKIRILPNSIERLQNLETLDLKHAYVSELPMGIFKLQKLRHLLVYSYNVEGYITFESIQGFKVGSEIGRLTALQKLCYMVPNNRCDNGGVVKELGRLNQLIKLGIHKLRKEDGGDLCRSIEMMTNLRTLSITSKEETEALDLQCPCSPPPSLQKLYMIGWLEKLPHWISSLDKLTKIALGWSKLRDDPLQVLEDLPNLVDLHLLQAYDGEELCFKRSGFEGLKRLRLEKLDRLRHVKVKDGSMPLLEDILIVRCGLLEKVPSGIEHLRNLKALWFFDMPDVFTARLLPDKGEDYSKVSHIPNVIFRYWWGGGWNSYSKAMVLKEVISLFQRFRNQEEQESSNN